MYALIRALFSSWCHPKPERVQHGSLYCKRNLVIKITSKLIKQKTDNYRFPSYNLPLPQRDLTNQDPLTWLSVGKRL